MALRSFSYLLGESIASKTVNKEVLQKVYELLKKNPDKNKEILDLFLQYTSVTLPTEAYNIKIDSLEDFNSLVLTIQAYAYIQKEDMYSIIFINLAKTFKNLPTGDGVKFGDLYSFVKENLVNYQGWSASKSAFMFKVK